MKTIPLIVLLMIFNTNLFGQSDSTWNVLLIGKGKTFEQRENMSSVNKSGFYLHPNCIYNFELKKGLQYNGRLIKVIPDTLFFTTYFNESAANLADQTLDTLALHYSQLSKLSLIADRSLDIYTKQSLDKFDFIFKKDTSDFTIPSFWTKLYSNDTTSYEIVPHLTAQGIGRLFEEHGRTYFYYGSGYLKPDRTKMDTSYTKEIIFWLTPCNVERIDGIALGLFAENIKNDPYEERDSLLINGLNIEVNPFGVFTLMNPHLTGPYPDSIEFYNGYLKKRIETRINGINISISNTINETKLSGLNATGILTVVDEINGVSLSGLSNFSYILNGLSIASLHNRATVAKGLQIGLINKASSLKGVQIGLWNINEKRSLPFINWNFKKS